MKPTDDLNFYGLRALGYDEASLGVTGNTLADQIAIEALCIRIKHAEHEGGMGAFGHFKNYVDLLWNNPDSGSMKRCIWNPWSNKMFHRALHYNELGIAGCACVSGRTRLLNPITGEERPIKEFCDQQIRPWVQTLNGPVLAEVPYLKGRETLFRYTLDNGSSFECTAKHMVLTSSGWNFASHVRCGESLFGYVRDQQQTNSDNVLAAQIEDVLHSSQTTEGLTGGYSAYFRLYGEQLQLVRDTARAFPPSPVGVRESSSSACEHLGALSREQAHNRLCLSNALSTCNVDPQPLLSESHESLPSSAGTFSLLSRLFQQLLQSPVMSALRRSFSKLYPHSARTLCKGYDASHAGESESRWNEEYNEPFSCVYRFDRQPVECCRVPEIAGSPVHCEVFGRGLSSGLKVSHAQVVSIENLGVQDFYDVSVPVEHHYFAEGAIHHNSAGKSDPLGLYGVVAYTIDPTHTLVLVMSTTIAGAKRRIWKTVREYWESIPNLPGKHLTATNEIRGLNYRGDGYGNSSGIYLLAGEPSAEKAALDRIIGIKAPRTGEPDERFESLMQQPEYADLRQHFDEETLRDLVPRLHNLSQDRIGKLILIIDEMTGVAESILNAVNTNLKPGNVGHFQIIALGNPNLPYDPFGIFCKPKGGWDKVDLINDEEWETETGGLCIRFNGEKNPRIVEGNDKYSWMLRQEDINAMAQRYGRESLFYHRMVLGTWCLEGEKTGIYSPADLEMSGAKETEVIWGFEQPKPVSFLDPSFTAGGDLAMATFGLLGVNHEGRKVFLRTDSVPIKTDPTNTLVPINYQIVKAWRKECEERGVKPTHAAYDRTGGGIPFGDIVSVVWSPVVTGITSGGAASRRPIPGEKNPATGKPVLACDRYANKATEIWYAAHPLLRSGQIFGISDVLAKEMCSRQHAKGKSAENKVLCVEGKRHFKDREGKSPDESDSFLGLVNFCCEKHNLAAEEYAEVRKAAQGSPHGQGVWKQLRERARRITNARGLKYKE